MENERFEEVLGLKIINLFSLKPNKGNGIYEYNEVRFDTAFGDKTIKGLGLTLQRIISDTKKELANEEIQNKI